MVDGISYKCSKVAEFFDIFATPDEYIRSDPFQAPELYWPTFEINYKVDPIEDFPLVVGSRKPTTGMLVYFTSTFKKYYEERRSRKISRRSNNYVFLYVDADVSGVAEGYPLKFSKMCLLLPVIDEIKQQDFLKKPFKLYLWILLLTFLVYFTVSLRLIEIPDLFLSFFESLSCIMGSIQRGVNNKYVYIQLFLFGFIIWNLHNAKLSSYLVTPNLGRSLVTVEDIYEANISLWAGFFKDIENNFTVYMMKHYPKIYNYEQNTFKGIFNYSIRPDEFHEHLYNFDLSHGYLVSDVQWSFISRSQMLLERKYFTYSDFCTDYGYLYPFFIPPGHKILRESVNSYILKVIESGLDFAWEERSYLDINFKVHTNNDESNFQILGFEYFEVSWWIIVLGIFSALLVFFVEVFKVSC